MIDDHRVLHKLFFERYVNFRVLLEKTREVAFIAAVPLASSLPDDSSLSVACGARNVATAPASCALNAATSRATIAARVAGAGTAVAGSANVGVHRLNDKTSAAKPASA